MQGVENIIRTAMRYTAAEVRVHAGLGSISNALYCNTITVILLSITVTYNNTRSKNVLVLHTIIHKTGVLRAL